MTFDVWRQANLMNGLDKLKTVPIPDNALDSIEDMKRLAGLSSGPDTGANMSITGNEKGELMKRHNIQPGTPNSRMVSIMVQLAQTDR